MKRLERLFEELLWNSRLMILIAVICTIFGALLFVVMGSVDIFHTSDIYLRSLFYGHEAVHISEDDLHKVLVTSFIGAVDNYMIAVVLIIFGLGLYEIFISNIDSYTDRHPAAKVLQIKSLDQLKNKLAKVIVIVLIVSLFKRALSIQFESPEDLLFLGGAILLISGSLFLINKGTKQE